MKKKKPNPFNSKKGKREKSKEKEVAMTPKRIAAIILLKRLKKLPSVVAEMEFGDLAKIAGLQRVPSAGKRDQVATQVERVTASFRKRLEKLLNPA